MWSQWVWESRMSAVSGPLRRTHELVAERPEAAAGVEDDAAARPGPVMLTQAVLPP